MNGALWHSQPILIPMQIAMDEESVTQQLLFLNQILIAILALRPWVLTNSERLILKNFLCWGVHPLEEVVGLCSHRR